MIATIVLGAAGLVACKGDSEEPKRKLQDTHVVADVIARVGSRSIGASEVEARMAADGITAEAAVEQLINEELLLQEAARLGFTEDREGTRTVERLMVRAMLHDLEKDNTPDSISEKEVREDYARHADKMATPERRRSWHILVKDRSDEGRAFAESILRELQEVDEPRTVYERYASGGPEGTTLAVEAEELPAITRKAGIEKPYKKALFAAEAEGPVQKAVKTSYGWHAIVVTEILPGEHRSIDEVEGEIRERLSQKKRFEGIVAIVQNLEAKGLVEYDEQGVERLLSMPGLPERAN